MYEAPEVSSLGVGVPAIVEVGGVPHLELRDQFGGFVCRIPETILRAILAEIDATKPVTPWARYAKDAVR